MTFSNPIRKRGVILVIVAIIIYSSLAIFSDYKQFLNQVKGINFYYIPVILAIHFLVLVIYSIRQKVFFDSLGIRLSIKNNISIHFVGLSLLMTPGGLGEIIKTHFLKQKYSQPYTKTTPVVLAEKYHDVMSIISILAIMLLFKSIIEPQTVVAFLAAILLFTFFVVRNHKLFPKVVSKLPRILISEKLFGNIKNFHETLYLLTNRKVFLRGWGIGIIIWFFDALAIYLCFLSLGLKYSFIDSTLLSYTALILGALSFLPGGLGITEVGMLGLFIKYGLTLTVATTLVLLIRLTTIWFYTIIGLVVLKIFMTKM